MRQIAFDTETTGLAPQNGDRIVEIGAVEIIDRVVTGKSYQTYLNPDRTMSSMASKITGITDEQLLDKPRFAEVANDFLEFIADSELIIHNASFDLSFLKSELELIAYPDVAKFIKNLQVIDTLDMARKKFPGKKNNLDILCQRYGVDNSSRIHHGALLDSEILAEVYLKMTAGQIGIFAADESLVASSNLTSKSKSSFSLKLNFKTANETELKSHEEFLQFMRSKSDKVIFDQN